MTAWLQHSCKVNRRKQRVRMLAPAFTLTAVLCKWAWNVRKRRSPWTSTPRRNMLMNVTHGLHISVQWDKILYPKSFEKCPTHQSIEQTVKTINTTQEDSSTLGIKPREWEDSHAWGSEKSRWWHFGGDFGGKHSLLCNGVDKSVLNLIKSKSRDWEKGA